MGKMKKFPSVEEMHRDFELHCLSPDVPKIQSIEIKKAFISGVLALFLVMKNDCGDTDVPDDVSIAYMDGILAELEEFFSKGIFELDKERETP